MKKKLLDIKINLKQPWLLSILFAACIPAFPEYVCPILAFCSLVAAFYDAKSHRRFITIGIIGKLILIYTAYMAVGLLYSPHFSSTLATVAMWAVMFMVYIAMTTVLTNQHRYDTLLFCISLIAGIVGIIGVFEYAARAFFHIEVSLQFWRFIDAVVFSWMPLDLLPITTDLRVSSTFNNPNIMAEYLIMVIPFVVYYSFSGKRTGARLLCRFCLLAAVASVLFSFSRGCYIALLVVTLVFCIANRQKIMLIIMCITSSLLLVPESVVKRLFSVTGSDQSINERLSIWKYGIESIKDHPLFGVGAGVSNTWDMLLSQGINAPHMHNFILQLFAEGGAVAVAIMGAVVWKMFQSSSRMLRSSDETRRIGVVFLAFIIGFFVDGLFDFPLLTPKLVGIFLMVLALADSAVQIYLGGDLCPLRELAPFTRRYIPGEKTKKG